MYSIKDHALLSRIFGLIRKKALPPWATVLGRLSHRLLQPGVKATFSFALDSFGHLEQKLARIPAPWKLLQAFATRFNRVCSVAENPSGTAPDPEHHGAPTEKREGGTKHMLPLQMRGHLRLTEATPGQSSSARCSP